MPFHPKSVIAFSPEAEATIEDILRRMKSARRVQCVGHLRPDGDCIGSLLGLHHLLEGFGVEHALAAESQIYPGYRLIPGYDLVAEAPRNDFNADLTIFSDCGDRQRAFGDWPASGFVVNIDHHRSNPGYGDLNWVDPGRASVGEMMFELACRAGAPISPDMATALLLAIMTDTGCFRYSSVRPEHFEICAQLVRAGGDVTLVSKAAYECRPRESVALESEVMAGLEYRLDGRLAWGEARRPLLGAHGGSRNLPENLVSQIRSIEGVRVAILFIEPDEPGLRCSFRGDGLIDCSRLAQEFGGGGHPNAAGLTIKGGDYAELRANVLARTEAEVAGKA